MIANRLGGLAAGAFDEAGDLQGFVFGLTGVMDGKLVHWSDMLAVRDGGKGPGSGNPAEASTSGMSSWAGASGRCDGPSIPSRAETPT